jgi:hypothetical protein
MLRDSKKVPIHAGSSGSGSDDGDPPKPPSAPRDWLFGSDESGTGGAALYAFGVVIMDWNRRGDIHEDIRKLREKHQYFDEIKWNKVKGARTDFFLDLVDYLMGSSRIYFHCMIVRKGVVDRSMHNGDFDLARRKHLAKFLTNKIQRLLRARPKVKQTVRLWIDPIASRYKKADEALEIIGNRMLDLEEAKYLREKADAENPILRVFERDSRDTIQIQLCDFLLGAVMDAYLEKSVNPGKQAVKAAIATHLRWPHLKFDTYPTATKFNIWYFKPSANDREVTTRLTPWESKRK